MAMAAMALPTALVSSLPASASASAHLRSGGPRAGPGDAVTGAFAGVSCTSASDCTAVGSDSNGEPLYATETGGVWGAGTEIGGGGSLEGLSCTASSVCTAIGDVGRSLYATETNGVWAAGPGVAQSTESLSGYSSVSCTAASDCAAVGSLGVEIHSFPLWATEVHGVWTDAGFGWPTFGTLSGVSCAAATDCTAVGNDSNGEGDAGEPTYVTESAGVWGTGTEMAVPGGGYFQGVSCPSTGDCVAIGEESSGGSFYVVDTGGVWGTPKGVGAPPTGTLYSLESVSCADATDCTIVGTESGTGGSMEPIAVTESAGAWGPVTEIGVAGGQGSLRSVNCAVATSCTAVGQDGDGQPIYVNESSGVWGVATEVAVRRTVPSPPKDVVVVAGSGRATISWGAATSQSGNGLVDYSATLSPGSKTCRTTATACTISGLHNGTRYSVEVNAANAVGASLPAAPLLPFIPGAPIILKLRLTQVGITYGNESSEHFSVTVEPRNGSSRPAGRVLLIAGTAPVCSMALRVGASACTLARTRLNAGPHRLEATYLGDAEFATTTSAATSLFVSSAASKAQLTLSMVTVQLGNEGSEIFTVTMLPQYVARSGGSVAIHTNSLTLCSITLGGASDSCALSPSELSPGTYRVVATYHGSGNFKPSKSIPRMLTVTT